MATYLATRGTNPMVPSAGGGAYGGYAGGGMYDASRGKIGVPASYGGGGGKPVTGGGLNFGSVPNGPLDYNTAYSNALNLNAQNYGNILSGYQNAAAGLASAQQGVIGGYNKLSSDVLGSIKGIGDSQKQNIADAYAQQAGGAKQGLLDRGLYNSTVNDSVQRGLLYDKTKADTGLANQMAQLTAGYQSQLGLAGLGYQGQAIGANTGLATKQLDWMNSINAPYPNASAYGNLALQAGQAQATNQLAGAALGAQKGVPQALAAGAASKGSPNTYRGGTLPPGMTLGKDGQPTWAPDSQQGQAQAQFDAQVAQAQPVPGFRGLPPQANVPGAAPGGGAPQPGGVLPTSAAAAYGPLGFEGGGGYGGGGYGGSVTVNGAGVLGSAEWAKNYGDGQLGNFPSDYETQLQQQQAAQSYQIQAAQEAAYSQQMEEQQQIYEYLLEQGLI